MARAKSPTQTEQHKEHQDATDIKITIVGV